MQRLRLAHRTIGLNLTEHNKTRHALILALKMHSKPRQVLDLRPVVLRRLPLDPETARVSVRPRLRPLRADLAIWDTAVERKLVTPRIMVPERLTPVRNLALPVAFLG